MERRYYVKEEAIGVSEEALGVGKETMIDETGERNETPHGSETVEAPNTLQSPGQSARLSMVTMRLGDAGNGADGRFLTRRLRERRQ